MACITLPLRGLFTSCVAVIWGKPYTPQQVDDSPTRLRAEPIMPELFANAVPQIMAIVAAHMNATNS